MQAARREAGEAMTKAAAADGARIVLRRIGEPIQSDLAVMHKLTRAGIQPGREVILMAAGDGACVTAGGSAAADPAAADPAGGDPASGDPAGGA